VANVAGGVVYAGFFLVAIRALAEGGGSSSAQPRQAAAGVLGWPGGQELVGVAGGALLAISLYQFYAATTGEFADDSKVEQMSSRERRWFMLIGRVGLGARALVLALVARKEGTPWWMFARFRSRSPARRSCSRSTISPVRELGG
jgi:Domain of Unknown Function (DUF1206)